MTQACCSFMPASARWRAARGPHPRVAAVIILRYAVVAREEAYLERRFGYAYRDYKARVRRWL